MKDILKSFEAAGQEVTKLRGLLAQALKLDIDPGTRAYLQSLDAALDQTMAEARDVMPKAAAQLQKEVADVNETIARTESSLAELDAKMAELEATPPEVEPAAAAAAAIDPRRGKLLRDELLQRFGPAAAATAPALEGRDVHDMASGDFREKEILKPKSPSPPPAKEPPQEKKPQTRNKELWDLSSGAWEKDE